MEQGSLFDKISGHFRRSRLLGNLVAVSVTSAAAAGVRSEETRGRVVPLITANHLLCEPC